MSYFPSGFAESYPKLPQRHVPLRALRAQSLQNRLFLAACLAMKMRFQDRFYCWRSGRMLKALPGKPCADEWSVEADKQTLRVTVKGIDD